MQEQRVIAFLRGFRRLPSAAESLQEIALKLQPLLARQEQIRDVPMPPQVREQRLKELSRELVRAGIADFNRILEGVCCSYCRKHEADIATRFEVQDFVIEVQILTLSRLLQFDPRSAGFSTWFSICILPRVYTDIQRSLNPAWGRPQPRTAEGRAARQDVYNFANRLSLDQPVAFMEANGPADSRETTFDRIPAANTSVEAGLLEQQCIDMFVQALQQLGVAERVLLRRLYVQQETQKAIAQSLGLTPAAVNVRLKKTCARLALLLGDAFKEECADTQFCDALRRSET